MPIFLFHLDSRSKSPILSGMEKDDYSFMEDFSLGQTFHGGPVTVSAEDIIAFAEQFDPQDFHTNPDKAKDTAFGEHVASGWHTAALTMKMLVAAMPPMAGGMIGRTVENMTWTQPVRPGDTLTYEGEILDMRPTRNPARGLMRVKSTTRNQHGDAVMEMTCLVFAPRRTDGA